MKPWRVTLHCSDSPNGQKISVDEIRKWHVARGFSDVGYHWVVYPDGTLDPGRPESLIGAHVKGANQGNLGICLNGRDKFTRAQFETLDKLLRRIFRQHDILASNLFCHYQFASAVAQGKTCPNIKVYDLHTWYFEEDWAAIKKHLIE